MTVFVNDQIIVNKWSYGNFNGLMEKSCLLSHLPCHLTGLAVMYFLEAIYLE